MKFAFKIERYSIEKKKPTPPSHTIVEELAFDTVITLLFEIILLENIY